MLDHGHGGSLCLEEHSKSTLVYTAGMCKINQIKACYWLFYFAYSKTMPAVTLQRLFFRGTHKVRDELQLSHFVG